jgi:hypothetical protein
MKFSFRSKIFIFFGDMLMFAQNFMVFHQKLFANFRFFAEKAEIFFVSILVLNEVAISAGWELAKKFGLESSQDILQ